MGIVAKSGTLSYESRQYSPFPKVSLKSSPNMGAHLILITAYFAAVASTTRAGLGQSLCIGVGGDMVPGTDMVEALSVLEKDPDTEAIALIGEIGGMGELEAAAWIKEYYSRSKSPKYVNQPTQCSPSCTGSVVKWLTWYLTGRLLVL